KETADGYEIDGSGLKGREYKVEGDFSGASFMLVLGAVNGTVTVDNLNPSSKQGDKIIVETLKKMNAEVIESKNSYTAKKSRLKAIDFDATDYPDLAPIVSVAMAKADGISRIKGARRLVDKESDRKAGIIKMLRSLGVDCLESEDEIEIVGKSEFSSADIDGQADHRMVMSAVVALSTVGGSVSDSEAVGKSYKKFFEDFKNSGGKYVR
ncbi:MAG: 3-phosphoshikimate 1-carboxyvinyltransferase, partial [Christensenellales bacterium]